VPPIQPNMRNPGHIGMGRERHPYPAPSGKAQGKPTPETSKTSLQALYDMLSGKPEADLVLQRPGLSNFSQ
jgi:hypothetical protein